MAFITPIALRIFAKPNNTTQLAAEVRYVLQADGTDVADNQRYREVCALIGDDTPGDGTDDVLRVVRDVTSQFGSASSRFVRDTVRVRAGVRAGMSSHRFDCRCFGRNVSWH